MCFGGFDDDAFAFSSVDLYGERLFESYDPQELRLLYCFLVIEEIFVIEAVFDLRIECEVTYAERGQVLEEVRSLTRFDEITR